MKRAETSQNLLNSGNQRRKREPRAIIGLAFNKPVYTFTFALLARLQTKFMRSSDSIDIAGQSDACQRHNTLETAINHTPHSS